MPGQTEVTHAFAVPILASAVVFEFTDLWTNLGEQSGEVLQCPRCSNPVTDPHGICRYCRETAFQCRNCRYSSPGLPCPRPVQCLCSCPYNIVVPLLFEGLDGCLLFISRSQILFFVSRSQILFFVSRSHIVFFCSCSAHFVSVYVCRSVYVLLAFSSLALCTRNAFSCFQILFFPHPFFAGACDLLGSASWIAGRG